MLSDAPATGPSASLPDQPGWHLGAGSTSGARPVGHPVSVERTTVRRTDPAMKILPVLTLLLPLLAFAGPKGGSSSSSHSGSRSSSHKATSSHPPSSHSTAPKHTSSSSTGAVKHDSHGKIERSAAAKGSFRKSHPCPSTGKTSGACPGYEVDHRTPLACGGSDSPGNMEWLTKSANRSKGAQGCRTK
jgi:hypothetical protein